MTNLHARIVLATTMLLLGAGGYASTDLWLPAVAQGTGQCPGDLVFNGNSDYLMEPGRSVTFEIRNNGCWGEEEIVRKADESRLFGSLTAPGLAGSATGWILRHYDKPTFDAWKLADPKCNNRSGGGPPGSGTGSSPTRSPAA